MIKRSIQEEDITTVNIYAPNIGAPQSIRQTADLSAETLQARREWQDIFKVMKVKNLQPRLLYKARISFRFD